MGAKNKETIVRYTDVTDDYDDKKLPDGTEPHEFAYEGTRYTAFLSDANKKKLTDALALVAEFVEKSDESKAARPAAKSASKPASKPGKTAFSKLTSDEKASFRAWAAKNTTLAPDARRIKDEYVTDWEKAGKPAA